MMFTTFRLFVTVCLAGAAGVATVAAQAPDLRLVTAAADQDRAAVFALLDEGVDVNRARADGVTALLWTAYRDDLEIAGRLIAAGADVNATDDHGVTPLERGAENASLEMVEMLLAAGANPNAAQESGLTPLMTAARTGNAAVVRALLAAGADVNATVRATRSTALMWAASEPHRPIVRLLLDAGADPSVSTLKGFTPLMFAARNGDVETARTLIDAGVDINAPSADGTHVLPFTIVAGQADFAMFPHRAGRRSERDNERSVGTACRLGRRRHLAARLVPEAWSRPALPPAERCPLECREAAAGHPRAAGSGGRPEQADHVVGDDHELHRLPEEGGVRAVCLRHR